ncbi:pilus assembly protein TadE [Streptomyces tateyamensis]|uniref:Pilus assembly protein TadE n=1 Tax=Streptomyces tateyamensis TaxID=565073 RepID=A0A2V4MSI7_9ACTN|nr:TadE/TadG family type IV pilus assembly protein [Streptomyces tateyamensis]PYC65576.1 pilus assembly protein TadE [Streptomyces tateyamensis]
MSAEMALITPVLLALLLVAVGAGRLVSARLDVADAAHQAARAASLARTPTAAGAAAQAAARSALDGAGLACSRLSTTADSNAFRPGGQINVTVACTADLAGLAAIPWPGNHTITETFSVPLETYRAGERR